jgi:hypothetical protein
MSNEEASLPTTAELQTDACASDGKIRIVRLRGSRQQIRV